MGDHARSLGAVVFVPLYLFLFPFFFFPFLPFDPGPPERTLRLLHRCSDGLGIDSGAYGACKQNEVSTNKNIDTQNYAILTT